MYFLLIISILLGSLGHLSLKNGINQVGNLSLSLLVKKFAQIALNFYVVLGFFFFITSTALWLVVISKIPISVAYPMVSLGYVFAVVIAKLMLKEEITLHKMAGVALICGGVFFISR